MEEFKSDGNLLQGHMSLPPRDDSSWHAVVLICQDYPHGRKDFSYLDTALADLIAEQLDWAAFVFHYSGCGPSEGSFSFGNWKRDIASAVSHLTKQGYEEVWIVGFGVGGTLGICVAAENDTVQGLAAISAGGDLQIWLESTDELFATAKAAGAIQSQRGQPEGHSESYPGDDWASEIATINALEAASKLGKRPFLVMHGQDDPLVPMLEARALADAYGGADLRILEGGSHDIRYDPRAISLLLGWLDRNRS